MQTYVLGFMFSISLNDVLLISKTKPEWQRGKLNGVGGSINDGESGLAAMVREFKEETGIETSDTDWKQFAVLQGKEFSVICFKAQSEDIWDAKTITDEEVLQISVDEFDKFNLIENVRWLVAMAMDRDSGHSFSARIFYK